MSETPPNKLTIEDIQSYIESASEYDLNPYRLLINFLTAKRENEQLKAKLSCSVAFGDKNGTFRVWGDNESIVRFMQYRIDEKITPFSHDGSPCNDPYKDSVTARGFIEEINKRAGFDFVDIATNKGTSLYDTDKQSEMKVGTAPYGSNRCPNCQRYINANTQHITMAELCGCSNKQSVSQKQIDAWTDKSDIPLNHCDYYTKTSDKE